MAKNIFTSFGACSARINGRLKATRPLNAHLLIEVDSQDNKVIRLRPVQEVRHA